MGDGEAKFPRNGRADWRPAADGYDCLWSPVSSSSPHRCGGLPESSTNRAQVSKSNSKPRSPAFTSSRILLRKIEVDSRCDSPYEQKLYATNNGQFVFLPVLFFWSLVPCFVAALSVRSRSEPSPTKMNWCDGRASRREGSGDPTRQRRVKSRTPPRSRRPKQGNNETLETRMCSMRGLLRGLLPDWWQYWKAWERDKHLPRSLSNDGHEGHSWIPDRWTSAEKRE